MKNKRSYVFQNKLTMYNATFIAIIILICSLLFYSYLFNKAKKQIEYDNSVLADSIEYDFNQLIHTNDETILRLSTNKELINLFSSIPKSSTNYFTDNPKETFIITELIHPYTFFNDDIGRLYVYTHNNDFFYTGKLACTNDYIKEFLECDRIKITAQHLAEPENFYYLSYPADDILSPSDYNSNNSQLFSITRSIFDYTTVSNKDLGYITIEQPTDVIDELFSYMPEETIAYIVDDNDNLFYTYAHDLSLAQSLYERTINNQDTKDYFVSKTEENSFGFTVYLLVSTLESNRYLKKTALYLFGSVLFFIFLFFLMEKAMVRKLTSPLQELTHSIASVKLDDISIDLDDELKEFDELKQISKAFNRMGEQLKNSVDEKVESETSTLQAQLLALQSQLNPHFFHNILTIISVMADENKNDDIVEVCTKLSSMLRFSSSYKSLSCKLEEELNHTKNYLALMKIRYEDMFTYNIDVDSKIENIIIPKYIFQPLAENCFNHGFKKTLPPWHIDIRVWSIEDDWRMTITDNGGKFSDESLKRFRKFINSFTVNDAKSALHELSIGGLGLSNIYIRLRLLYRENSYFEIDNKQDGKTIITIGGKKNECIEF